MAGLEGRWVQDSQPWGFRPGCLPGQLGAFYRESALGEPSEFVHGSHLTAACGPFTEVA